MADDWDDWGDDDSKSESNRSEGWEWPVEDESRDVIEPITANNAGQSTSNLEYQQSNKPAERLEQLEEEARLARRLDERTDIFFNELRNYQLDLADPSVRERINEVLSQRDFRGLAQYYEGRDDLAAYTLDTELQRMSYSVVTAEGDRVGDKESNGAALREYLSERRQHAMVRMANQSMFADMLEAVQGSIMRPDLEISIISRECGFSLDFSKDILDALSLFVVSTAGSAEPRERETLEIAQIKGVARVDTRNQTFSQSLLSPQLRMVFDDDMRASARVLSRHSLMDGGLNDIARGGGLGGRGGSGLGGMDSLRQSLARLSSDSVGRTAAASTGLIASVVAGMGSAIGASRNGSDVANGGEPPLRLYRRGDEDNSAKPNDFQPCARTAPAPHLTMPGVSLVKVGDCLVDSEPAAKDSQVLLPDERRATCSGSVAVAGGEKSSLEHHRPGRESRGSGISGDSGWAIAAASEPDEEDPLKCSHISSSRASAEDRIARENREGQGYSAVGAASAAGGAVLRGLWGGFQGVQSVAATTLRQESGKNAAGGETSVFRLYRRDGENGQ